MANAGFYLTNKRYYYRLMHQHVHDNDDSSVSRLRLAFILNLTFTIVELVGGYLTNSVAITSDAIHDLGDSVSLGLALYLQKISKKKADRQFTFGYRRVSLVGALLNAIILAIGSTYILAESISRLYDPQEVHVAGMIFFALFGIVVNGYAAFKVSSGKTLNERIVSWHLLEDVLGWAAVLLASIFMLFWELPLLDSFLAIGIALYILFNVLKNLKRTVLVFLQAVPDEIRIEELEEHILKLNHVHSIHDCHLWSLDGEYHLFSAHVVLIKEAWPDQIIETKSQVKELLKNMGLHHVTLELEMIDERCRRPPH